ncbi:MAG: ATP-dependent helicase, partial [Candidatus Omnitrophica bacterium]|nr:ATP-dependent helicase [Candidatus Omnitrophota bacterium]
TPEEFEKYVDTVKKDDVYIQDKHIPRLKALAKVYKLYEAYKRGENKDVFDERGRYDFDDMIMLALETVKKEKQMKEQLQQQYTYIMVDEYQDTNGAQLALLAQIAADKNPNICCVGDDDQSIYRFQGASAGNFKFFLKSFAPVKLVSLEDNYRSSKEIVGITAKIINQLPETERVNVKNLKNIYPHKNKITEYRQFSTEAEELLYLAGKIQKLKKQAPYDEMAVLVRKREDILKVTDMLQKKGIPYATDGKEDIANEKRVRQMLDVLYLADCRNTTDLTEKDRHFYRIISSDYFKIPMQDILKLINTVKEKKYKLRQPTTLFLEFMNTYGVDADTAPASGGLNFAGWVIKRLLNKSQAMPVHSVLMHFIKDANLYGFILESFKTNKVLRIRDLRALSSFVSMVKNSDLARAGITLSQFLDEIDLKKEHGMSLQGSLVTRQQEGVRVFTAHGSKGLEFNTVFVPFCLQDKSWPIKLRPVLIPLPVEIFRGKDKAGTKEEIKKLNIYDEIRLFYVASSRAKSQLIYTASPTQDSVASFYIEKMGFEPKNAVSDEEGAAQGMLGISDKKDPFIGTKKILKDMVSELSLNPTSINTFIACGRKFLYNNVLMIPSEKKRQLVFGTCVHKALEEAYVKFKDTGKFPDFKFFRDAFMKELKFQGVDESIYSQCKRAIEDLQPWLENESKNPVMPLGLEERLAINIGEIRFTGYYDKTELVNESKKTIRVIDYKTGKPDEHIRKIEKCSDLASDECDGYLRQIVAYKLLFDGSKKINNGYKVATGELVFINTSDIKLSKNIEIEITDSMVSELTDVIKRCWKKINSLEFEKLPNVDKDKCGTLKNRRCDYYDICWM